MTQTAYAAYNRNPAVRRNSSSGAVFPLLARQILQKGGAVYGAALDEHCNVICRGVTESAELAALTGSKYVFVPITPVIEEIASRLSDGQPVLAVVSPCQAGALRRACGDAPGLVIVDFVCHGAPDAAFLRKYLDECAEEYGRAVTDVQFRKKREDKSWDDYAVQLRYADGQVEQHSARDDPYMRVFLHNASLRRGCAGCTARGENRASDLTLGDFWGVRKVAPKQYCRTGTSLVFVNTPCGERLWQTVSAEMETARVDPLQAVRYNPSAVQAAALHPQYEQFWRDSRTMRVRQLADKYCRESRAEQVKRRVKDTIKQWIK